MQHPDGTPYTDAELTAERVQRWTWLDTLQRSAHPLSPLSLLLAKRYARCELATIDDLIEEMCYHNDTGWFPERPDGPEVTPPPSQPAPGDPVIYEGVTVMPPGPLRSSREELDAQYAALIERERAGHPDDPLIGQWVSFTACASPEEDERELN